MDTQSAASLRGASLEGAVETPDRVRTCYSLLHTVVPHCGVYDLTDGIYHGDPNTTYGQAQRNQAEYLLDEIRCEPGSRVLEIGCGYGTLLQAIKRRKATGVGITVSPPQVKFCRGRGLDVRLLNYREIGSAFNGRFDAVVANGSLEHFAQPTDAAEGRDDAVYRELFEIAHRVLARSSPARRFVTTAIHFARRPNPLDLLRNPYSFPRGSDEYHFALLLQSFGGWYPVPGQLERCAAGRFELVRCEDGTDDYRRTSEHWVTQVRKKLFTPYGLLLLARSLPEFLRHPAQYYSMFTSVLTLKSWSWQFAGDNPPTRLLRQTWQAK